jgi:hypothetical protein
MKTIPLTRGKIALVDDGDYEKLKSYTWHASKSGRRWYAATNIPKAGGGYSYAKMHRLILGTAVDKDTDHEDGDGLNNQRKNLREMTRVENSRAFRRKPYGKTSPFRGVSWAREKQRWSADLRLNTKRIHLGYFSSELDAARAYDCGALQHFGTGAIINL